jgi:hypothetical protein
MVMSNQMSTYPFLTAGTFQWVLAIPFVESG